MIKISAIKHSKYLIISCLLTSLFTVVSAQNLLPESNPEFQFDYALPEPIDFNTLQEAAEWADVVAVAQVVNVDYQKTRDLNAKGQAFLTVRVPYKGIDKNDLLIVSAKGFEDYQCYYPDRLGEGQRYLVFLKQSTENDSEYHGFKPFCQLQVLLDDAGLYNLRYPTDTNIEFEENLIKDVTYQDPNALIDGTEWTSIKRQEFQESFKTELITEEDLFQKYFYLKFTQGIPLSDIRPLLNVKRQAKIDSDQM
ncbi:hypothetical protein [Marinicella gelatinilytica]|uniref:hypothetical protein n=1 Tax=Marinicella gelatinilytica TaxID=2996017 RepID=UPI002260FBD4|nr:hypothetical protein [Marinicella gelatinilytica]MCX7546039.1 hypothetical protein [Marinicella gelatinilytica]